MDVCSSYNSDIGFERLSEIAIIILSLKFIGSFEAAAFSTTNLRFPPSRFSLLSSGRSLFCLPHFAPTASRTKKEVPLYPFGKLNHVKILGLFTRHV